MTTEWTRQEASSSGQVFEFRLWSTLIEQSRGRLHVFLPLSDRGIDAIVHRRTDGAYFRVQAKGRSSLIGGEVRLVVSMTALIDDGALLVSGLIIDGGLGATMLAVPVGEFKRLAEKTSADGKVVYSMSFGMSPRPDSRWTPFLIPVGRLAERFGLTAEAWPPELGKVSAAKASPTWRSDLGFLGEAEAMRLLAETSELNLFRPFPDLETAELLVLNLTTRDVVGLQIKTIEVDGAHPAGAVHVLASSFRASPTTSFIVFAWLRDDRCFHEDCLVIPSQELLTVTQPSESAGHLTFEWRPDSGQQTRLQPYRRPRSSLAAWATR